MELQIRQLKGNAADSFNALTKDQKVAKFEEIRACLKSGAYVLKTNDNAKKSEAFDLLQIINDKRGNEIYCFYYCTACADASNDPIIFADTRNGTSKILSHHRSHKKKVSALSENFEKDRSGDAQNGNAAGGTAIGIQKEIPQTSTSYVFDINELALLLSKMTSIGYGHGVLDPDAIKSLLPQAHQW